MKNAVFSDLDIDERQSLARSYTDSAERWLRHLIHSKLSAASGTNYITQGPFGSDLQRRVVTKIQSSPSSFPREVDATTFDQLVVITCHPKCWHHFEPALIAAYPLKVEEARRFLTRIQDIRNEVAHLRPITVRQLEQALCYSNDLSDSIKNHFEATGMANEFYVPTFLSYADSLGNRGQFQPSGHSYRGEDLSTDRHKRLYPGDTLTVELEVDPSFDVGSYSVVWWLKTRPDGQGNDRKAVISITEAHISQRMELQFKLTTTNSWHRDSSGADDIIDLYYRVPPRP